DAAQLAARLRAQAGWLVVEDAVRVRAGAEPTGVVGAVPDDDGALDQRPDSGGQAVEPARGDQRDVFHVGGQAGLAQHVPVRPEPDAALSIARRRELLEPGD